MKSNLELLGNPQYPAMSYSGHRNSERTDALSPSVAELKEDMRILAAMGIKLIRTYNTQDYPQTKRMLAAIRALKEEDPGFEMVVMLGVWIQCVNAFEEGTDHTTEDAAWNQREIETAIQMVNEYPDIIKIIAVGNEAMVDWQAHFVPAKVILKWVDVLGAARAEGRIPAGTLLTTSDNWAALGGEARYRNDDLAELMRRMDFVSLHTYAFHDTYYNPALQWGPLPEEENLTAAQQITNSVARCIQLQKDQYAAVEEYLQGLGVEKEIHIGETGWATLDNAHYGNDGTAAASEFTAKVFYDALMEWTTAENITCFYFQIFDEPWKSKGTAGSEGHFGLITVDGQVKYPLWQRVDEGVFDGLSRGGHALMKSNEGEVEELMENLKPPKILKH